MNIIFYNLLVSESGIIIIIITSASIVSNHSKACAKITG